MGKPISLSAIKKKVWKQFSIYIRLRDCIETTGTPDYGTCFTCKQMKNFKELQAGHFTPGRTNSVLFDEKVVHAQCYHCNVGLKGNWPAYYERMVALHGLEEVERIIAQRNDVVKYSVSDLEELLKSLKVKTEVLYASV